MKIIYFFAALMIGVVNINSYELTPIAIAIIPACHPKVITDTHKSIIQKGMEMLKPIPDDEDSFSYSEDVGPKQEWKANYQKGKKACGVAINTSPKDNDIFGFEFDSSSDYIFLLKLYTSIPLPQQITYCLTDNYLIVTADRRGPGNNNPSLTYAVSFPTKKALECLNIQKPHIGNLWFQDELAIMPLNATRSCVNGM